MEIYACSPEVNCWEVRRERERTKVIHLVSKNSTWIKKTFLSPLHMGQISYAIYSYLELTCNHPLVVSQMDALLLSMEYDFS